MAYRPAPPAPSGKHRSSSAHRASHKPRIGQYIIERTLGSGSFGKVKRESNRPTLVMRPNRVEEGLTGITVATHAITGHQVALKFINRAKITTPDMNARVKREIQYLKVLRHPHIIKL